MDFNEMKSLLGSGQGKIVIVENNKPVMVIFSYEDYKKVAVPHTNPTNPTHIEEAVDEELTVDDLPL